MYSSGVALQTGYTPQARGTVCPCRARAGSNGRVPQPSPTVAGRQKEHTTQAQQQWNPLSDATNGSSAAARPAQKATSGSPRRRTRSRSSSTAPSSWPERMASIQALMSRVQEQLQGHTALQATHPALAKELKLKAEQHLDLLMQLAEAEQRYITGDLLSDQLQQLLDEMQQLLEQEQQEALAAIQQQQSSTPGSSSSSNSNTTRDATVTFTHTDLLNSEDLRRAISKTSAGLSSSRKQQPAAAAAREGAAAPVAEPAAGAGAEQQPQGVVKKEQQLQEQLLAAQQQLQEAEAALLDTQELRKDYDHLCQHSFELSCKLSLSEAAKGELQRELSDAKAQLVASAEELAEHRELQMQYDTLCQDMYRLRMTLQQVRTNSNDAAHESAATATKHKQDLNWLMQAHRRELAEAHRKNQELTRDAQELRMRLLEREQQLWSQDNSPRGGGAVTAGPGAAAAAGGTGAAAASTQEAEEQAAETTALVAQQKEELALLQQAGQQLTQEKAALMKNLQDSQRQQAVLLVELQQLRDQQRQQAAAAAAASEAAAAAATAVVQEGPTAAEQELIQRLEDAMQQRTGLIQQVQQLQQGLQETREAAAAAGARDAAAAAAVVPAGDAGVAAVQQLKEVKAEIVQLRGQLAATRRELHQVSGRVASAEAALQQQAADYEARLAQLATWYGKQAAVVAQLRKGKAPAEGTVGFTNTNRFWVRQELLFDFLRHWVVRESLLQQQPGFMGLQLQGVSPDGGVDVVVSSYWGSIPAYEAFRNTEGGRQQHMPSGVYQYVPKRGEGFPEDFVPFRDYDEAVNAKY